MKKKYIQLGVVTLVLLGMVAAFMLVRNAPGKDDQDPAPEDAVYVGSGDVPFDRIEITNPSGAYELVKNPGDPDGGLIVKGWENLSLDAYSLNLVSDSAKEMAVKEVIAENAPEEELKAFGLDNPRAQAKIYYETGGPGTILFGDNAPGSEGVYVKTEDSDTIFLIMPSLAEPFLKPAVAYVNKTVTETDADFKGFDKITLTGSDYPEPIIIERTPETAREYGGMSFGTHGIVSPVKAGVDYQRGMEPLSSVYGLLAHDVVAVADEGSDTAEAYGLNDPAAVISVTGPAETPGLTFTLRVSATDENGNVRLMKSGSPVIYEMPAASLPWLGLQVFDYMDRMAVVPDINTVSALKVAVPGKTYAFAFADKSDELTISLDGSELPAAVKDDGSELDVIKNFRQYYQTLVSASYSEETDLLPPEGAQPVLTIEYSYKAGGPNDVVTFYAGPTRRVFISANGGKFYLTQSSYVDRVTQGAENIASGREVKSYL